MSSNGFTVRVAHPDELVRAGEIARDAYLVDDLIRGDNDYADLLVDAPNRARVPGVEVLVAVGTEGDQAGVVAGTITVAEAGSEFADIAEEGELELRMLGVSSEFRGRGVGELLMRESIARAHERGLTAVLSLLEDNTKAERLYERLKMQRVRERDWDIPEIPELGTMRVYCAPPKLNRAE